MLFCRQERIVITENAIAEMTHDEFKGMIETVVETRVKRKEVVRELRLDDTLPSPCSRL